MASERDFPLAPWGKSAWIITLACVGGLVALAGWFFYRGATHGPTPGGAVISFVIGGALLVLLLLLLAFAPRKYVVTPSGLVISRLGPKVRIGFEQMESVELVTDPAMLRGVIRVMGVGGAFGWYGRFWGRKLGAFHAYIVRTDGLALIRRKKDDPVLLSPRDPAGFVEQVKKQMAENGIRRRE